ncbi:MAG: hypothetical protein HY782_21455 [Chloroflexi bacterium]|nr:hypothetical protein [Chloroflexota bacterium]
MNEAELVAYLAGLFDAEGTILIEKKQPRWNNKSTQYILTVSVTNTRPELVRASHEQYGEHIVGPIRVKEGQKPFYRWSLSGAAARDFLRDIEPYLIIKRDRVALAYELQDRIDNYRHKPVQKDELGIREGIYLRFRRINKRGVSEPDSI